jgi:hypothetical protein
MVAITAAIGAVSYAYFTGLIGSGTEYTPLITITPESSGNNAVLSIIETSDRDIQWDQITWTLVNRTTATQWTNTNTWGVSVNIGSGVVSGGQMISISGNALLKQNEYSLRLIYIPSGGTMSTVSWRQ